jgi:3-mercaptopyruvate sulfurtransferase SseA
VYCSVGIRSARVADRLRHAGIGAVYNLDGSIFRWASEGRPVVRDGEPVRAVHPYNAVWGRLLPRDLHPD